MIAVFSFNRKDFNKIHFTPRQMFIRIKTIDDIMGRKFIGIIETDGYWKNGFVATAHKHLKERQPELFI